MDEQSIWKKDISFGRKKTAPVADDAPTDVIVHPPVPASELPPLPEAAKPAPFWKREITLGRGGSSKPKSERAPKEKKEKRPKKVKATKTPKTAKAKAERTGSR